MSDYKRLIDIAEGGVIDPTAFIRPSMEVLDESLEKGFNVVTANNPWLNLLEASSTMSVAAMEKSNTLTRRQYRNRAQSEEDLYYHLSDRDYRGRFGSPSNALFYFSIPYEWLLENAVTTPTTNEDVVYIPKDTQWSVNGIDFYQHHDIKVQLLASGDVQVYIVYDEETPLYTPETLLIETREVWLDGQRLVEMAIPVEQLSLEVISNPITANGYRLSHTLADDFYYCRAFTKNAGTWNEVKTTHSEQVYDPLTPTVVLKVTDKTLEATIPDIYVNSGLAGSECRLLIYTTKGDIAIDLSNYTPQDFTVEFDEAFDANVDYWSILSQCPLKLIYSISTTTGGRDKLSFEELRNKSIYNLYDKPVAVTDRELDVAMSLRGYGVYKRKHTVAEQVYVTTKEIPKPSSGFISSGPAVTNKDVLIDTARNDASNLVKNGDIFTLRPGALFKSVGYDVALAGDTDKTELASLDNFSLCDKLNEEQWYYTPFHYVIDNTNSLSRVDAYYLDKPKRLTTSFVNFNPNIDYAIKTKETNLAFNGMSYVIEVIAEHPDGLIGLHLQMRTVDREGNQLHLNAVQAPIDGTTSSFTFTLNTNLAIDRYHRFQCADLKDATNTNVDTHIEIVKEFEFIYLVEEAVVTPSPFDSIIETIGLVSTVSGVTYDKITFEFGTHLDNLNVDSKTVQMQGEIKRHTADVPLTWDSDVYLKDDNGRVWELNEATGKVEFTKLHLAGDPVLDEDGNQRYKHKAGYPVLGGDGKLIYITQPYLSKRIRLFLVDAKYLYASDTRVTNYRDTIPDRVIESLVDMKSYSVDMLERTKLLFEPTGTANLTLVTTSAERQTTANTAVKFYVRYTMEESRYNDIQLRNAITQSTKQSVANFIANKEFSMSALIAELDKISDNVNRNVDVTSSLPGKVVRIQDGSSVFSVKSRLVPSKNNQLTIEDDIDVEITK